MYLLVFLIGATGGMLSGLLGIGGGIVLFPALLYLPPLMGFDPIGVREVTGLTMVQGFFASLIAFIFYRSRGLVHSPLVLWLGIPLSIMSLMGALYSGRIESSVLLLIFGILAVIAAVMILRPPARHEEEETQEIRVIKPLALVLGSSLGFFLGMVGQGGAFIVIPVMLVIFRTPFRIAAGSMLAISLMATTAGFAGKAGVGLIPLDLSAALLIGAIPLAWIGGVISGKVRRLVLRRILALIILLSALRIGADIYSNLLN